MLTPRAKKLAGATLAARSMTAGSIPPPPSP